MRNILLGLALCVGVAVLIPVIAQAARISSENSQIKKDERNQGYADQKINEAWAYLAKGKTSRAFRSLNSAKMYFGRISDAGKEAMNDAALKARLDGLTKAVGEQKAIVKEKGREKRTLAKQKSDYCDSVVSHVGFLYMLKVGKNGDAPYSLSKLNTFCILFDRLDIEATEFRKRFAPLIKAQPDYAYSGLAVIEVLDLLENKMSYRDALVSATCRKALDELLGELTEVQATLESGGKINSHWLNEFYGRYAQQSFQRVKELLPFYEWIGGVAPQDRLDMIAAFKPGLRNLLEEVSRTKKITISDFPHTTTAMQRVAVAKGEELEMQLMHVGSTEENEWMINKNNAGYPLRRVGRGYAVYNKNGEPFLRKYEASFLSEFNGNGYESVSQIFLSRIVSIGAVK